MKTAVYIAFYIVLFIVKIHPGNLTDSTAAKFIEAILHDDKSLKNFVLPEELKISNRLGASYFGIKNKFIISNDIDSTIREEILNHIISYDYTIKKVDKNYSKLILKIPSENIEREYIFFNSFLISKPFYYSRNWKKKESKYFKFFISDPEYFNDYSEKKLDSFIDSMTYLLDFTEAQKKNLENEKIYYFLCRDNEEIKKLTGYEARGLFFIPYDYIITTYNCHCHEILHLLINYKLKNLHLYTLPLLQEGFAVAYGGRGGKVPGVILNMGLFLSQSGFLDYQSLLSKSGFNSFDATMTYPVSGLFVKFLIESFGINKFLKLYRKYSSASSKINSLKIDATDLPSGKLWTEFLNRYSAERTLKVSGIEKENFPVKTAAGDNYKIFENEKYYLFELKGSISIYARTNIKGYKSHLFNELFSDKKYEGQKYIVSADSNEISIYNLYSNNLIAKYVKSFSISDGIQINKTGYFVFSVKKNLFDEPLNGGSIFINQN